MTDNDQRYHAAVTTGDVWICYPWEAEYVIPPTLYLLDCGLWLIFFSL